MKDEGKITDEVRVLVDAFRDGDCDATDATRLRELVRDSETARQYFVEQMMLSAALKDHFSKVMPHDLLAGDKPIDPLSKKQVSFLPRVLVAAAVLLLAGGVIFYFNYASKTANQPPEIAEGPVRPKPAPGIAPTVRNPRRAS